jgi:hypothetical protein
MAFRKKTLRVMSPTARKVARLTGELESVSRRLKNLIPDIQRLDLDSNALFNIETTYKQKFGDQPVESGQDIQENG